jgi:CheY-like chemotaxis protein
VYKILIADDERALRLLIAGTLEIGEYDILEADNGIQALDLVKRERPDLIILDVMMPGITGYEVCKRIKTNPDIADTKVLILTAKGQQSDEEAAWEALADFYLAKPFSPMELLSMVEEVLSVFARKKRQFIGGKSRPI